MKVGLPEAKHINLLTILLQVIYQNQKLFFQATLSFLVTQNPGLVNPLPYASEPTSALHPTYPPTPRIPLHTSQSAFGPGWHCPCLCGRYGPIQYPGSQITRNPISNLHLWIRSHCHCPVLRYLTLTTMTTWVATFISIRITKSLLTIVTALFPSCMVIVS